MLSLEPSTRTRLLRSVALTLGFLSFLMAAPLSAQTGLTQYTSLAPLNLYMMDQASEVALARSAGPAVVSEEATVLYFTGEGYDVVARGSNGFTCLVLRSWTNPASWGPTFWNPRVRVPICYNPEAAETVLPIKLKRAEMALDGASAEDIERATHEGLGNGQFQSPSGMAYMVSAGQYLSDRAKSGIPHLMLYKPYARNEDWGGLPIGGNGEHPFILEGAGTPLAVVIIPMKNAISPTSS